MFYLRVGFLIGSRDEACLVPTVVRALVGFPLQGRQSVVGDFEIRDVPVLLIEQIDDAIPHRAGTINHRKGTVTVSADDDGMSFCPGTFGMKLSNPAPPGGKENMVARGKGRGVDLSQRIPGPSGIEAGIAIRSVHRVDVISRC